MSQNIEPIRPPEVFPTERLELRLPVMEDAETIFRKYAQDEETTRYLIWRPHENVQTSRDFISRCIRCWQDGSSYPWCIIQKSDNELAGMLEYHPGVWAVELGYVIAPDYRGKGYATELTKAIVQWALAQKSIFRVWATCDTENHASARVLEKAGMQREGILRRYMIHPNISEEPRDSYCFAAMK